MLTISVLVLRKPMVMCRHCASLYKEPTIYGVDATYHNLSTGFVLPINKGLHFARPNYTIKLSLVMCC